MVLTMDGFVEQARKGAGFVLGQCDSVRKRDVQLYFCLPCELNHSLEFNAPLSAGDKRLEPVVWMWRG